MNFSFWLTIPDLSAKHQLYRKAATPYREYIGRETNYGDEGKEEGKKSRIKCAWSGRKH
jgi:hypothetical protein